MPDRESRTPDREGDTAKPRPRSPFLGVVGGAGEAAGGAAGSALDAATGLASGLADALEGVVREATGSQRPAASEHDEARDEPRERP